MVNTLLTAGSGSEVIRMAKKGKSKKDKKSKKGKKKK
jgi:hypothetical protein